MKEWWRIPGITLTNLVLSEALTALAAEAKKRGISYGNLIASTSGWEQDEIIRDYCAEKRRNRRNRRKK